MRPHRLMGLGFLLLACLGGGRLAAHGDLDARLQGLGRQIGDDPTDATLYLQRADLHREHRDWEAAWADLARAAALDPQGAGVDWVRGRLLLDQGDAAGAEAALRASLARAEEGPGTLRPLAHATLGDALLRQGRAAEAAAEYGRAIALAAEPGPDLYLAQAQALMRADPAQRAQALAVLDGGLARLGPLPVLRDYAIGLELEGGNPEAALARLEQGLAGHPPSPAEWRQRGALLERAGRRSEALAAYRAGEQALQEGPVKRRITPAMQQLAADLRSDVVRLGGGNPQ